MRYPINYDINNLKYSNTQGKVGIEFDQETKDLLVLQSPIEIQHKISLIERNKNNDDISTINEIKDLLKKQDARDNKIYNQILDEAFGNGIYNGFKRILKKTNLCEEDINLQLSRIDKYFSRIDLDLTILVTKKYYDRVRPSILSKELYKRGIIEKELETWIDIPTHPAYPSGHATQTMYIATILTHFDQDNKELYEQIADEISTNREIAGLHYRSDSLAGYELGRKLANKLIDNNFE